MKVEYRITKGGEVRELHVLYGDPALAPAAIAAVSEWRYAPCRIDGSDPIEVKTVSDVAFSLNQ